MLKTLGYHMYACGKKGLPKKIDISAGSYNLRKVLKHDFFAATALYELATPTNTTETRSPSRLILKMGRQQHFIGLPLRWLGKIICSHEISILSRLSHLQQIPHILDRWGKTGFTYEYIEGQTLDENKNLPDDFFDNLIELTRQIHQNNVVYVDSNKRNNLLLGDDGKPYIIDFQISQHFKQRPLFFKRFSSKLKHALQRADIYHILKHKRRICPHLLKPEEKIKSRRTGKLIDLHRMVATPFRKLRRRFLKLLYDKGVLADDDSIYPND
ncbi:hypothetical protein ACFL3G_12765 [Planctomycetota bacterium]